jgi:hypothetical protein
VGRRWWDEGQGGGDVPIERYQRRYQAYLEAYSQVYRDRFTAELAERLGLPQQVVNDLVQEAVVVQRARAEGLEVTDEELSAQIQVVPAFQDGGRFSLKRYQEFLRRRGLTEVAFENDVRRELTRIRMENTVKGGVKVSGSELEQAFVSRREEVRAAWALVEVAPLVATATISDAELGTHLKDRADEFRQPERRKIQYVTVSPKDFVRPASDADLEKYYKEHAAEFETPRQARASHILVRVPETGGSEAEDKAKAKVAEVIGDCIAGKGKLYRYGGDEFVVILPGTDSTHAAAPASAWRRWSSGSGDVPPTAPPPARSPPTHPAPGGSAQRWPPRPRPRATGARGPQGPASRRSSAKLRPASRPGADP